MYPYCSKSCYNFFPERRPRIGRLCQSGSARWDGDVCPVITFHLIHTRKKSGIQLRSQIVWTFHFWSPFYDRRHPLAVRLQCLISFSGTKKTAHDLVIKVWFHEIGPRYDRYVSNSLILCHSIHFSKRILRLLTMRTKYYTSTIFIQFLVECFWSEGKNRRESIKTTLLLPRTLKKSWSKNGTFLLYESL